MVSQINGNFLNEFLIAIGDTTAFGPDKIVINFQQGSNIINISPKFIHKYLNLPALSEFHQQSRILINVLIQTDIWFI